MAVMRAVFVQLPYPGDLAADLEAAAVDTVVIQNPADQNLNLYPQAGIPASLGIPRIFVGSTLSPASTGYAPSVSMPAWAASSKYIGAMTNPDYRWRLLSDARVVWARYLDTYGSDGFATYISHEASLATWANYAWSGAVRSGYEALIVQAMRDSDDIAPYGPILWSPYVWEKYSTMSSYARLQVAAAVTNTVPRAYNWVRTHDQLEPNLIVDLQDGVGAGAARGVTKEDALGWLVLFKDAGLDTLGVNVEAFGSNMQSAADTEQRAAYYEAQGIRLGASFELRYWGVN